MTVVVKTENLGKKFIISHERPERYTALRDVLVNKTKEIFNKTRSLFNDDYHPEGEAEEFWALKDINLEIKQGDRLGIIGKNGAGKSTLLKVLSRITEPTTGWVGIKGRVASLLEVGTGFHPELTGKENIFLNGAILGMTRAEIRRKFDEIVDFSGVEKFLDTPVKRYSSGMRVRLAFSVAAHLEPEILIIDEVLAVGDADFQKKCLGKMDIISRDEGRTIIFVSHNLGAVQQLCNKAALLNNGTLVKYGNIGETIGKYINENNSSHYKAEKLDISIPFVKEAFFINGIEEKIKSVRKGKEFGIRFFISNPGKEKLELQLSSWNNLGTKIWSFTNSLNKEDPFPEKNEFCVDLYFKPPHLNFDQIYFHFGLNHFKNSKTEILDHQVNALILELNESEGEMNSSNDTVLNCSYRLNIKV